MAQDVGRIAGSEDVTEREERDPHFAAEVGAVAVAVQKGLDHHSDSSHAAEFPMPNNASVVSRAVSDVVVVATSRTEVARDAQEAMKRREDEAERWMLSHSLGDNGE